MAKELNKVPQTYTDVTEQSTSKTQQSSATHKTLNDELVARIMAGLAAQMSDEEISAYAQSLLDPQRNAAKEAAQQQYEAAKLGHEQEIENIAAALARSIQEQQAAYRQGNANIETAALARGMGRSSYTLDTLAGQARAYAGAVQQLSEEAARGQKQAQAQITLAGRQNAQTQGRIETDYAAQLAAKVQELKQQQAQQHNQNYMSAVSAALGSTTNTGSETNSSGSSETITGRYGEESSKKGTTVARPTYSTSVKV
ncbi:MAG: hypothetical protein IJD94_05060 [Clostridia bacterium]|nr:hypothetical protein [Clostridia bacterium]